jgi:hypothetical protein
VPDAQFFLQAGYTLVDRGVTAPTGVLHQCATTSKPTGRCPKVDTYPGYFGVVKLACRDAACRSLSANFSRAANIAGWCSTVQA